MPMCFFSSKFVHTFSLFSILGLLFTTPVLPASLVLDNFNAPTPRKFTVVTAAEDLDTPGAAGQIQIPSSAAPVNPLIPLYYRQSGINTIPVISEELLLFGLDVSNIADFNWYQTGGIAFEINRSGPIPSISHTLEQLSSESVDRVPEPETWSLLLAGLSALWLFKRRDSYKPLHE